MLCERCKFAKWDLTASGRKHPSGRGQCTWTGTLRVAATVWVNGQLGKPYIVSGGTIWRTEAGLPSGCDTFQKLEGK
jgi:hypothetical protein